MSNTNEADVAFIKALADVLRDTDLTEIEVNRVSGEDDELQVRLSRGGVMQAPVMAPVAAPQAAPAPVPTAQADAAVPAAPAGPDLSQAITSPMVGTAYLSPEPDAPAFVKAGDTVSEGDTVLIIEAMKTMNQIPAPRSGTVDKILVANGEPIEFGAPLMIIT